MRRLRPVLSLARNVTKPAAVVQVTSARRDILRRMPSNGTSSLDNLDSRLILTLRAHPRVGVLEVARRLGLARGTVQAPLAKLQARGVITGFGTDVDPARMAYPVLAFVFL